MTPQKLKKFFEENGFTVNLLKQDGVNCAEIGKYTNGGVDMNMFLNPFKPQSFYDYINDFDVDETVIFYMTQDPSYKSAFTLRQSLDDFTEFLEDLKHVSEKLVQSCRTTK